MCVHWATVNTSFASKYCSCDFYSFSCHVHPCPVQWLSLMLQKLIYLTSNSNINTSFYNRWITKLVQANTNYIDLSFDQQTRELNKSALKRCRTNTATKTWVTYSNSPGKKKWHASKLNIQHYKVHKLYQRYILILCKPKINFQVIVCMCKTSLLLIYI